MEIRHNWAEISRAKGEANYLIGFLNTLNRYGIRGGASLFVLSMFPLSIACNRLCKSFVRRSRCNGKKSSLLMQKNFVSAPLAEPGIEMDEACATPNQHSLVALQQFFLPYSPLAHFALSFTLPIVCPENCKQRPERVDVFSAELHRTKLL